jgi:hypothetical protein
MEQRLVVLLFIVFLSLQWKFQVLNGILINSADESPSIQSSPLVTGSGKYYDCSRLIGKETSSDLDDWTLLQIYGGVPFRYPTLIHDVMDGQTTICNNSMNDIILCDNLNDGVDEKNLCRHDHGSNKRFPVIDSQLGDSKKNEANLTDTAIESKQHGAEDTENVRDQNLTEDYSSVKRVEVDYASKSAGAIILEQSNNFQGTENLLQKDVDRYAIVPCNEPLKYVVVGLSEGM